MVSCYGPYIVSLSPPNDAELDNFNEPLYRLRNCILETLEAYAYSYCDVGG